MGVAEGVRQSTYGRSRGVEERKTAREETEGGVLVEVDGWMEGGKHGGEQRRIKGREEEKRREACQAMLSEHALSRGAVTGSTRPSNGCLVDSYKSKH